MKPIFASLCAIAVLSACAPGTFTGTGFTAAGENIAVTRIVENYADDYTFQAAGKTCKARVEHVPHTQLPLVRTTPVTCDGGVTGKAVVTYTHTQRGQQHVTSVQFSLSNGLKGQFSA